MISEHVFAKAPIIRSLREIPRTFDSQNAWSYIQFHLHCQTCCPIDVLGTDGMEYVVLAFAKHVSSYPFKSFRKRAWYDMLKKRKFNVLAPL